MIIDKIENSKLYVNLGAKIAKSFAYINETDLSRIAVGKYEIDNGNIFAIVQKYDTRDQSECKLEGHWKHMDIQYIISGVELIGVATLINQIPVYRNEEEDYALFEGDSTLLRVETGMFAIFFPDDLHMPGVKLNQISPVKKVVVKVRI
ncbi:YhcH/YjgK/YiaL family protein [bacterium]|nr:DUF386 domain-containing protein [bacterium]MBU3955263.1 YhcH/YjgK/YiaL family protein [bacterium]MBU4133996.1 YhcH/YjgK/YiaL family protein [bacterium]